MNGSHRARPSRPPAPKPRTNRGFFSRCPTVRPLPVYFPVEPAPPWSPRATAEPPDLAPKGGWDG